MEIKKVKKNACACHEETLFAIGKVYLVSGGLRHYYPCLVGVLVGIKNGFLIFNDATLCSFDNVFIALKKGILQEGLPVPNGTCLQISDVGYVIPLKNKLPTARKSSVHN